MMRASSLHRSPLLLLAAALLALAVFAVQDSRPVSADHGDTTFLWSGTLTVKQMTRGFGCANGVSGAQCSSSSVLTDDSVDGSSVAGIHTNSGTLVFQFEGAWRTDWTLHVGSSQFPLSEATLSTETFTDDTATWTSTGLSWSAGDTVELRLRQGPPPTGVRVSIWDGTLTIPTGAPILGCANQTSGYQCSSTSRLTDDDFTYGGTDYNIETLAINTDGNLTLGLDSAPSSGLRSSATLYVDGKAFHAADASVLTSTILIWADPGLSWAAGDTVEVRLGVSTLPVTEGGTATFFVALTDDPDASTTVQLVKGGYSQSNAGESGHDWDSNAVTYSPETLTFTSSNYSDPQTVTVTAPEDLDNRDEQLIIMVLQNGGPVGGGSNTVDGIHVTVADNDTNATVPTNLQGLAGHGSIFQVDQETGTAKQETLWLVRFSWGAPARQTVTGYDLQWTREGGGWPPVSTDISDTSVIYRTNLDDDTVVDWRVRARTDVGVTDWATSSVTLTAPAANVVTDLDVLVDDGSLTVVWNAPTSWPVTGYEVEYQVNGAIDQQASDPAKGWVDAGHTGTDVIQAIPNLENGTEYRFRVRVESGWGYAWVFATGTPSAPGAPATQSPTAVTLAVDPATVSEGGSATLTATLDAPAPDGGTTLRLNPGPDDTATRGTDYTMPAGIDVAAGERSGTATITVIDDGVDEDDETATITAFAALPDVDLAGSATLTITDDAIAGVTERQQSPQASRYADLIAKIKGWRDDPCCAHLKAHTDRWDRTLLTFGETVADSTLTIMTAAEAQTYADRGWNRWVEVTAALKEIEAAGPRVAAPLADVSMETDESRDISLSGVFSGDGALTFTAASSDEDVVSAFEFHGDLTLAALAEGSATITVTAEDSDGNTVSDEFDVSVTSPPSVVSDLRCIAETGRVAFLWNAPEWPGGDLYAYDYRMTLPDGRSEGGRLRDITLLLRPGAYQAGGEADVSVTAVYETSGGSQVSSVAATLTCTVA